MLGHKVILCIFST